MAIDRVLTLGAKSYELINGKWFHARGGDRVQEDARALLAELAMIEDQARRRPGVGWQESSNLKEQVEYHKGMAVQYRKEIDEIRAHRDEMQAKLAAAAEICAKQNEHIAELTKENQQRSTEMAAVSAELQQAEQAADQWRAQCFHGDPQGLLQKMCAWAEAMAATVGIPRRRWTCDAIRERVVFLASYHAEHSHRSPELVREQIEKCGTPVVFDGTGETGRAEASPQQVAHDGALGILIGADHFGESAREGIATAIAYAIQRYHDVQEEGGGG